MPEMDLRQLKFKYINLLLKTNKEYKNIKKQKI